MAETIISEKRISDTVRREVIDVIREVLSDPDAGLALTPKITQRLKYSQKSKKMGHVKPLAAIFEQYGV
ncbi:MAG: hypothetical protein G01um101429_806 [Parcubacteria group bacterium Gr01-1014_29]|nr:MAG: hypothetical protein G01um101429_806 [Parcubacteria group bacterium Gr01-1014_29]